MTFDELKIGMKSLFSSLGAKTSDSNYAVGLFDKTSAEPKGIMDMASLASVLGALHNNGRIPTGADWNNLKTPGMYSFNTFPDQLRGQTNYPEGSRFGTVAIIRSTWDGSNILQVAFTNSDVFFIRYCIVSIGGGETWGNWYKFTGTQVQ